MNPQKALDIIDEAINNPCIWNSESKSFVHDTVLFLADWLREYLDENQIAGRAPVYEKINDLKTSIPAMLGTGDDNGHPFDQHRAWASGALGVIRSKITATA